MARHYSRFASLEEKRNTRRALRFMFLTGLTLVLLFFFGLPLVVKFAAFLTDIRKGSIPIEKTDTTPPAPPQLKNLPEATNETSLAVEGTSESGATVLIYVNEDKTELVADDSGIFTTNISLDDGENVIYAFARDKAGNEGQKTKEYNVIFDNVEPILEITSPADGASFSGSKNQKVKIEGKTESDANLVINERFVTVRDDGTFSFEVTLSEGDNTFNVKASDKAGNATEKNLTLKYAP